MKATMDSQLFGKALEKAVKAVYRRAPLPNLEQIRVDVADSLCRLSATNLEQYLTVEIPAEGEPLSFLFCNTQAVLKASKFFNGTLSLEHDEAHEELLMTCEPRSSRITVDTVKDYPEFPEETPLAVYHTNAKTLCKRFDRVKYAIADQNSARPEAYKGVRFMDTRLVAVDGYRVASHQDASLKVEKPFILPEGAMKLLQIFGDADISIETGEKWCVLHGGGLRLTTRLLEYDHLNIDGAIPTSFQDEYTADVQQFTDGLNYFRALVPEKARRPVEFADGTLKISASNGVHQSSIALSAPAHVVYGFDGKFMLESLNQFKGDLTVTIKVCSPRAPIVLTNNGDDLALVFPVKLKEEAA